MRPGASVDLALHRHRLWKRSAMRRLNQASAAGEALERRHYWMAAMGMFAVTAVLALTAYWPIWPGDSRQIAGIGADPWQAAWFLEWTATALAHGHNLWLTNYLEYPRGVNLGQNTLMPLLGVLISPITIAIGPIASFNVLVWLAFPVSATACFVLLVRWTTWMPAACIGALIYGFSPYMVAEGLGHLNIMFVPFPPLVLLLFDELLVQQRRGALSTGVLLGISLALEFYVSSEVCASTLVMATLGVLLLAVCGPRNVVERARYAWRGVVAGAFTLGAIVGYPAWVEIAGPSAFSGPAQHYPYPADVLATGIPTRLQAVAPSRLVEISRGFTNGDLAETVSYLGIPLLLVLVGTLLWRWRLPRVRFAAAMAVLATVVSLGPWVEFEGRRLGIPLPDAIFSHTSFFGSFIYSRFALYADLFAVILLALAISEWRATWTTASHQSGLPHRKPVWRWVALGLALVAIIVPLVPAWPYAASPLSVPSFFTTAAVNRIRPGSVVLSYPYASATSAQAMLWQALSSMRFRLIGGYALVRAPTGGSTYSSLPLVGRAVPATLISDFTGVPVSQVLPGAHSASPSQLRAFLSSYSVGAVVLQKSGVDAAAALSLFEHVLGPPKTIKSIDIWLLHRRRG